MVAEFAYILFKFSPCYIHSNVLTGHFPYENLWLISFGEFCALEGRSYGYSAGFMTYFSLLSAGYYMTLKLINAIPTQTFNLSFYLSLASARYGLEV